MKPVSLDDLRPEPGKFFLRKFDREFTVHPITMADEVWIQRTFGQGAEAAEKMKTEEGTAKLAYHLLSAEDKAVFKAVTRLTHDDNGNETEERVGGWELLAEAIIGLPERILLQRALLQTKGISYPVLDAAIEQELKKKGLNAETLSSLAGRASSTSSPPNMDGHGTISGPSRRGQSVSHSERSPSVARIPESLMPPSTGSSSSGSAPKSVKVENIVSRKRNAPKGQ